MFARLFARRRVAADPPRPRPRLSPPEPELEIIDGPGAQRADAIRAAWLAAGLDETCLGPEFPALERARRGERVTLCEEDRSALSAYAGVEGTSPLTSDAARAAFIDQIQVLALLRDLRDEGITIQQACRGPITAANVRQIGEIVRQTQAEMAADASHTSTPAAGSS